MGLYNVEIETTRVNYNLPTKLVNRVKEYAKEMGIPITSGIILLLNKGLDSTDTLTELTKLNKFIDDYNEGRYDKLGDRESTSPLQL